MSDWADEVIDTIRVPNTAGPTDPAVIIGQDAQPILEQFPTPQLAGLLWQLGNGRYYVQSVDIDNNGDSRIHLLCWDDAAKTIRSDVLEATLAPDNSGYIELMDGQLKLSWDATRSVYKADLYCPAELHGAVTLDDTITPNAEPTWQPLSTSNWTPRAGYVNTTYRADTWPPHTVEVQGVGTPSVVAGGTQIFQLPAGFRPTRTNVIVCQGTASGSNQPVLEVASDGIGRLWDYAAGFIGFHGFISLNG